MIYRMRTNKNSSCFLMFASFSKKRIELFLLKFCMSFQGFSNIMAHSDIEVEFDRIYVEKSFARKKVGPGYKGWR